MKKKAIIIGGSKGIGKAISNDLKKINFNVIPTSRKQIDTSNINSVHRFVKNNNVTDVLVLNTGGPPAKTLLDVTEEEWVSYFNQLFLSFVILLKKIKIKKNGYVFLISSHLIKSPKKNMVISNSLRLAFSSILKTYGEENLSKRITTLNLAVGPIYTERLKTLNPHKSKKELDQKHPMKKIGHPNDISNLIKAIIENDIKYLNNQTLVIDGGMSNSIF
tara:strand:- start:2263 stop:2919 length:657 start_codon:yes stop_codon:yes gene_type:complete